MSELPAKDPPARSTLRRWLPLAVIVVLSIVAIAIGWNRKISFETLVRHNETVHAFILGNKITAVAIYVAIYVVAIALSLPGGLILTMSGGFLFGGLIGGTAAVIGATTGALHLLHGREERVRRAPGAARGTAGRETCRRISRRRVPLSPVSAAGAGVPVCPDQYRAGAGRRAAADVRHRHRSRHHPRDLHLRVSGRRARQRDPRAGRDL